MAVLAPGLAQAQTFGACFNPLINPSTATTSANVGSVVRFYGINNLSGCNCGGNVTATVTVQGLDASEGASVRIYGSAPNPALVKAVDVEVLPFGPQTISFSICVQASRPYVTSGCPAWTSQTYCEPRYIQVNQTRVQGSISASPSVLIVPPGQQGTIQASWSTSAASSAEVWVEAENVPRTRLSTALSGNYTYSQAQPGKNYKFQLYANGAFLGQSTVQTKMGASGTLTANPTTVFAAPGSTGSTTLTWSTQNASNAELKVSVNGQAPALVARSRSGQTTAPWIVSGSTYVFTLHSMDEPGRTLASVTVQGKPPQCDPRAGTHGQTWIDTAALSDYVYQGGWCSVGTHRPELCFDGTYYYSQYLVSQQCQRSGSSGSCYDPDAQWWVICKSLIDCIYDCSGQCVKADC